MTPGTYTATVTVTDAGERDRDGHGRDHSHRPARQHAAERRGRGAAPQSGNAPLNVRFTVEAWDPDKATTSRYLWEFGDGATSTFEGEVSAHLPPGRRAHGNADGHATRTACRTPPPCRSRSATRRATRPPTVQIAADPDQRQRTADVRFTASGRDPEGGGLIYTWDFGDGGQAAGRSATHTVHCAEYLHRDGHGPRRSGGRRAPPPSRSWSARRPRAACGLSGPSSRCRPRCGRSAPAA